VRVQANIGEGAYGKVHKCRDTFYSSKGGRDRKNLHDRDDHVDDLVAIKKIKTADSSKFKPRERE
jgi:serine/threonine protein kinase